MRAPAHPPLSCRLPVFAGGRRAAVFLALISIARGGVGGTALAAPAGQILVNRAEASHDVAGGASLTTVSSTVSTLLPPVSGVALTPDDAVVSGFVSPAAGIV